MRTNPTTSPPGVSTIEEKSTGRIDQIIRPMLDVTFPPDKLPYIYNALVVQSRDTADKQINVTCEGATLGRIFNVLGEPIDNLGPVDSSATFPIRRSVPAFIELDTKLSIFETGIKVVDLLAPYRRG
ncbi:unnamed protein product [Triticum turgidum subsp. durum]|uniref:H(+)-transporting two-sector ATPase n=1 Tax=Triticum turgidum subsp. durum TaxID=4567 RepID=A0A9R0S9R9_TRITD|nr:unnamed protein product [Triticum turgidum subsp. durum]